MKGERERERELFSMLRMAPPRKLSFSHQTEPFFVYFSLFFCHFVKKKKENKEKEQVNVFIFIFFSVIKSPFSFPFPLSLPLPPSSSLIHYSTFTLLTPTPLLFPSLCYYLIHLQNLLFGQFSRCSKRIKITLYRDYLIPMFTCYHGNSVCTSAFINRSTHFSPPFFNAFPLLPLSLSPHIFPSFCSFSNFLLNFIHSKL